MTYFFWLGGDADLDTLWVYSIRERRMVRIDTSR